jgi:hypothetical protein
MATGIRVRGAYGQLQISDDAPTYMRIAQGGIGPEHKITTPQPGGSYLFMQQITFPFVVTTAEPPLVFMRFYNMIQISWFSVLGSPGAWTGFLLGSGIGVNVDLYARGDYFVAASVVPKSNEYIGIRIRNKNTNEIIFDSGYPLVKFIAHSSSTWFASNEENSKWNAAGGGLAWAFLNASRPANCYQLMNTLGRFVCEAPSSAGLRPSLVFAYDPNLPTTISLSINGGNANNFNIGYYIGCFIFALPGD